MRCSRYLDGDDARPSKVRGGKLRLPLLGALFVALTAVASGNAAAWSDTIPQYPPKASNFSLSRSADGVSGTLSGPDGQPIAGAQVRVEAIDVAGSALPTRRSLAGTVPAGAARAVIGFRVGVEDACICGVASSAMLGGLYYREVGQPVRVISPVTLPVAGAPVVLRTLDLAPGKTLTVNLAEFAVTAGAAFGFDAQISAPEGVQRYGYAAVIFLDGAGKELSRDKLWFEPSTLSLTPVTSDAKGGFRVDWPPDAAIPLTADIRAVSDGILSLGPISASLPAMGAETSNGQSPQLERILPPTASPVTILGPRWQDFAALYDGSAVSPGIKAQWDQTASRIQAIRLSGAAIMSIPARALAALAQDLKARNIALGLEILATNWWHEPACGKGIEGYTDPDATKAIVAKLLKADVVLDFIAMDEPFWFGHLYSGENACQSSLEDLARRVAVNVRIFTAAFPNVAIGDIEPFPAVSKQPNWRADYAEWVKAIAAAVGTPLTFLDLDFNWSSPSMNTKPPPGQPDSAVIIDLARTAADVARENGLKLGMIMNGGGSQTATSDAEWLAQARRHIEILRQSAVRFDRVWLESWDKYPAHTFSEDDPANTLSGLVTDYLAMQPERLAPR